MSQPAVKLRGMDDSLFSYSDLDPDQRIPVWGPEGLLPLGLDDPDVAAEGIHFCHKCNRVKLHSEFYIRPGSGRVQFPCSDCIREYQKRYAGNDEFNAHRRKQYANDPEKQAKNRERHQRLMLDPAYRAAQVERVKKWVDSNPLRRWATQLSRYSITPDDYEKIFAAQGSVCAGCLAPPNGRKLAVDHNHRCCDGDFSCGACIRGLLCDTCNRRILGNAEKNRTVEEATAVLRRLADYLEA